MRDYIGNRDALSGRLVEIATSTYPDEPTRVSNDGGANSVVMAGPYVFKAPHSTLVTAGDTDGPRTKFGEMVRFEANVVRNVPGAAMLDTDTTVTTPRVVASHPDADDPYNIFTFVEGYQMTPVEIARLTPGEREQLGRDIGSLIVWISSVMPVPTYHNIQNQTPGLLKGGRFALLRDYRMPKIDIMRRNGCPNTAEIVQEVVGQHESNFARKRWPLIVCHGDLRLANLCFRDNRLCGIFDFGQTIINTPADELAHIWRMGPEVVRAAISQYQEASGHELDIEAVAHYALISLVGRFSYYAIHRSHQGRLVPKDGSLELLKQLRPDRDLSELDQFVEA